MITIEKGDDEIHFEYDPQVNAGAVTKAYEYIFTNPMSVSTGIGIKPVTVPSGVTVAYKVSSSQLSASSLTSGSSSFTATTISAGGKMYAYVIVTASSESTALSFTSSVTWYYGKIGTMTIRTYIDSESVLTKTMLYGQYINKSELISAIDDDEYMWFSNSTCTTAITFPFRWQGETLYGVNTNELEMLVPWDHMGYHDGGYCYYGSNWDDEIEVILPDYYWTSANGLAKVTHIHYNACYNVQSLEYFEIGAYVESIDEGAFINCINATIVFRPNNVMTTITAGVFSGCHIGWVGLTALTRIEDDAFYNCSFDSDGSWIGDCVSLQYIGENAFRYSGISTVIIPASVEWIGIYAFGSSLSGITFKDTTTWHETGNRTYWISKGASGTDPYHQIKDFGSTNNADKFYSSEYYYKV